jgi:predicted small secreted protein
MVERKMSAMTRKTIVIATFAALPGLSGCATVEGLGQDISAGARTVGDML